MTRVSSLVRASKRARAHGFRHFDYSLTPNMIYAFDRTGEEYLCLILTNDGVWVLVDTNDPYSAV